MQLRLERRHEVLRAALNGAEGALRCPETLRASAAEAVRAAKEEGLEGLAAKRVSSIHEPGERTGAEVMKGCCRVKPEPAAQIEYTGWTAADHLRHSRFAGLREDKKAREVVKETTE